MTPLDVTRAVPMASDSEFHDWLTAHGNTAAEVIVSIYKKASGRQTVTFEALLETALRHGWVDTQTKTIDEDNYAIRFVRRRTGSNWSATNRAIARRLLDDGLMTESGRAVLPPDL